MEDRRDPFYTPFGKTPQPTPRAPAEEVWSVRHEHVQWTCELRFQGESYGWQATILRNGELFGSQRFILRARAVEWGEEQRRDIERGWIDDQP